MNGGRDLNGETFRKMAWYRLFCDEENIIKEKKGGIVSTLISTQDTDKTSTIHKTANMRK